MSSSHTPRAPFRALLLAFVALVSLVTPAAQPRASAAVRPQQTAAVGFADMRASLKLSAAQRDALMAYVAESVLEGEADAVDLPAVIRNDKLPRILFLSVSDGETPAQVIMKSGRGVLAVANQAIAALEPLREDGFEPLWVKLDLVQTVTKLTSSGSRLPGSFEPSLQGLAFSGVPLIAFLPEELISHGLVNESNQLQASVITRYLATRGPGAGSLARAAKPAFAFTSLSVFSDGEDIFPLYRGHRLFSNPTSDELLEASIEAGEYLTRSTRANGQFVYEYRPTTDEVSSQYNIVRHAGTIYAMMELYEVTEDADLLAAAQRAIEYLESTVETLRFQGENLQVIVEDDVFKLGSNGLGLVALAKYTEATGDEQYLPLMQELAEAIGGVQRANGSLISQLEYPSGEVIDFESEYYPGEAMLGLARLHQIDGDERWLDIAVRAARYQINVRDRGRTDDQLPHDHWLLYALNDLYRERPDALFLNHSRRIAGTIMRAQLLRPKFTDYLGGYYSVPRTAPVATRSEGLAAAYLLFKEFGSAADAKKALDAVKLGVRFQLQTQFQPESAMYLKDPQRALGGFHESLTVFDIRNDFVQHNVSALLALRRILDGE